MFGHRQNDWGRDRRALSAELDRPPHNLHPRYNVCSTYPIDVVTEQDGMRALERGPDKRKMAEAIRHDTCHDCGAALGRKHKDGCEVERCPHCGGQAPGCVGFDPNDPRRQPWNGRWPGEEDAERLGFFVGGDCSLPDINRLFAE
jgi:hypothetical protein